mgnify:CR=1 FL=1
MLVLVAAFEQQLQLLNAGVTVAGRPYQFLAFSSSQLKEQSVWMVACGPKESQVGPAE